MIDRAPRGRLVLWALLVPASYLPSIVRGDRPDASALVVLAASIALALAAPWLLGRGALDRLAVALEPVAGRILFAAIALYVAGSTAWAGARLAACADYNQLGLFSQSFWTLLRGHPFSNTHETLDGSLGSHFGVHFSPTLLLIAPVYAVYPRPIVLIAAQSLALGLAPLPLYHLLKPRTGAAGALALAFGALAIPNLLWAGFRDFRDANFLPVLLLGMVWALERRRLAPFLLFGIGALGIREEMGIMFLVLGLYAWLRGRGVRVAAGIAALGLVWFAVVVGAVMPRFWSPGLWIDPKRFFVDVLGQWGATPIAAAKAMLTHPADVVRALASGEAIRYLYVLLRPLLFLPPLGDPIAIVALPGLAVNLLSRLPFMRGAYQAYSLVPITFLCAATALLAARVAASAPEARRRATGLAAGLIVLAGVLPSAALTRQEAEPPSPPRAAAEAVVRALPPRAAVYAPVTLYPALANRENFGCWWSLLERGRETELRGRYEWIVLWLPGRAVAGDPSGGANDAPLADSLAHDLRFERRPGFDPFVVYRRR